MIEGINPNLNYLLDTEQRVKLLQGSTRSGKTWSVIDYIIWNCHVYKGLEIDITRNTYNALKATAWTDFENRLRSINAYKASHHNKSEGTYLLDGNLITYFGADNEGKVHGKARDILWVNEAQLMDEGVIDQLFPRTRYEIICDFNPALGDEHWLDKYIEQYPPFITTYKDNPHLTQSQIEDIESRRNNKYWWSIYGEGKRANVEGAIFENWEVGEFPECDSWFGQDFGFSNDPSTLIEVFIEKDQIFLKEHFYETHLNTSQIFELNKVAGRKVIIADSAEARLISELKSKGCNIQAAVKGKVNEDVMIINNYKLIVDPNSHNLKKELSKYKWADKGKTLPIDDHNHLLDAMRYAVMFKLSRPNYGKYTIKGRR